MSDRHNYYFGEYVTEEELDEGFDYAEQADWDQLDDLGLDGICIPSYDVAGSPPTPPGLTSPTSWTPRENAPPDWNVIVDTGYGHDKEGKRLAVDPPTTALLDCEDDYLGVSNAVAAGQERWIGIFLKYAKTLSDPRIDDNGVTVYFDEVESYTFEVHQGPSEAAPATTRPSLISDGILLCDWNVDENTGVNGLLNADRSFTRTEFLVNLDLSAILGSSSNLYARNLEEAFYLFADEIMGGGLGPGILADYLRRDGGNDVIGSIEPDTDDTYFWGGAKAYFRGIFTSSFSERPTATSFGSQAGPDTTMDALPTFGHWGTHAKQFLDLAGQQKARRDLIGRDWHGYHEEREDFNWPNGWTGASGVDVRWKWLLTAGGALVHNPSAFAQLLAGGFAQTIVSAPGDGVDVYCDGWIYRADLESHFAWRVFSQTVTGTEAIFIGARGATGNFLGFMFDPTMLWGYGTAVPAYWCIYDDGVNAPLLSNTGIAPGGPPIRWGVAFETEDSSGDLWLIFYVDNSITYSFNLTTGGGTYGAQALGEVFDFYYLHRETAATTSRVLLDYYDGKQNLDP